MDPQDYATQNNDIVNRAAFRTAHRSLVLWADAETERLGYTNEDDSNGTNDDLPE